MPGQSPKSGETFTDLMAHSFRQVPTFGRDTIRKFGGSVSSLTKMTARGFEDILQVRTFARCCYWEEADGVYSVGYLSSRDCFPNHTTRFSWT